MDFCKCLWSTIRWHRCFFQVNELTTGRGVMTLAKSSPLAPAAPLNNTLLLVRFYSEWEMEACAVDYFTEMQSALGLCLTVVTTSLNRYRCQRMNELTTFDANKCAIIFILTARNKAKPCARCFHSMTLFHFAHGACTVSNKLVCKWF